MVKIRTIEVFSKEIRVILNKEKDNDYIKIDECDTWEDESNADGNFMVTGKGFKYGIPYKTLYAVNVVIYENLKKMVLLMLAKMF